MKNPIKIHTPVTSIICEELCTGDRVLLSGSIITGRDTAHKRLFKLIAEGRDLPVKLDGETIFYAAPTPPTTWPDYRVHRADDKLPDG